MFSFPLLLRTLFFLLLDRHQAPNLNTCIWIYHQINNMSNRKRKEHLRTIGMRGIRNARMQMSSNAREKLEHSYSFMFPFLLLLGPLFLPLPCSQTLKGSNCGTIHASGVYIYMVTFVLWCTLPYEQRKHQINKHVHCRTLDMAVDDCRAI